MANQPTERLVVGQVRGLHGLRGAVRVEVLTDDPTRFAVGAVVHLEGEAGALTVAWVQEDGPGLLVRFAELSDRAAVEALRERYLEIDAPPDALAAGAYYWHQVVGARVATTDGRELGTVEDIFRAGGGEVFVVDGGAWGELMVPAVSAIIREFAPAEGRIVVDAGSLGLDEAPPVRKPRGRRTTRAARAGTLEPAMSQEPTDGASPGGGSARRGVTLRLDVITIFPGMFPGPLGESIPGRAMARGLAELHVHDLRDWGLGRHRSVDDAPYGGGAGMVMRPEPIGDALDAVAPAGTTGRRILLDPGGRRFDQALARELALEPRLVFVCPRYEGVDDRVRSLMDLELSIGDYVLSGGELAALVVMDAVLRLLPGAIDDASSVEESFSDGLLEYPQYTRPPSWRGMGIPDVLVSGHHGEVARWRQAQALERTRRVRPDLLPGGPPGDGAAKDALYSATDRKMRAPRADAPRRPPADHDTRK